METFDREEMLEPLLKFAFVQPLSDSEIDDHVQSTP